MTAGCIAEKAMFLPGGAKEFSTEAARTPRKGTLSNSVIKSSLIEVQQLSDFSFGIPQRDSTPANCFQRGLFVKRFPSRRGVNVATL